MRADDCKREKEIEKRVGDGKKGRKMIVQRVFEKRLGKRKVNISRIERKW